MKHILASSRDWDQRLGYSKKVYLTADDLKRPGQQVQTLRIKPGERATAHHHERQTEIFYFPKANGEFIVNHRRVDLHDGDVLVIEPGDVHETANHSTEDFIYVCFKLDYAEGDSVNDGPKKS